jgi:uncharacterized protein (UPF0335 family)
LDAKTDFDDSDLIGHNNPPADVDDTGGGVAGDQLKAYIERIETLEEEKAGIAEDIKSIYAEAKGNGFDSKIIRKIVALRKRDHAERQEEEAILEVYLAALGMA